MVAWSSYSREKNLNCCVGALGTRLEESYYLDAVKCRPDKPVNRRPPRLVRQRCRGFLKEQMMTIRPVPLWPWGRQRQNLVLRLRGEEITPRFKLEDVVGRPKEWEAPWGKSAGFCPCISPVAITALVAKEQGVHQ